MKVTIILIVICVLDTGLVQGLESFEIRVQVDTIQTTAL